jgi:hypothetical protein
MIALLDMTEDVLDRAKYGELMVAAPEKSLAAS